MPLGEDGGFTSLVLLMVSLAGRNSQVNFKWFDEGLAEYEGRNAPSPGRSRSGRGVSSSSLPPASKAGATPAAVPPDVRLNSGRGTPDRVVY